MCQVSLHLKGFTKSAVPSSGVTLPPDLCKPASLLLFKGNRMFNGLFLSSVWGIPAKAQDKSTSLSQESHHPPWHQIPFPRLHWKMSDSPYTPPFLFPNFHEMIGKERKRGGQCLGWELTFPLSQILERLQRVSHRERVPERKGNWHAVPKLIIIF